MVIFLFQMIQMMFVFDCTIPSRKFQATYPEMMSTKMFVGRRTIQIPRVHIYNANCCLKVHNVNLKLLLPIAD